MMKRYYADTKDLIEISFDDRREMLVEKAQARPTFIHLGIVFNGKRRLDGWEELEFVNEVLDEQGYCLTFFKMCKEKMGSHDVLEVSWSQKLTEPHVVMAWRDEVGAGATVKSKMGRVTKDTKLLMG